MGTTSSSLLRSVPESATTRTSNAASSSEETKGTESLEGGTPSVRKTPSSKDSGSRRTSFSTAYRQALKKSLEASQENGPDLSAQSDPGTQASEKVSGGEGPSRKKPRKGMGPQGMIPAEVLSEGANVKSPPSKEFSQPGLTGQEKKVLWGPQGISKASGPIPPSSRGLTPRTKNLPEDVSQSPQESFPTQMSEGQAPSGPIHPTPPGLTPRTKNLPGDVSQPFPKSFSSQVSGGQAPSGPIPSSPRGLTSRTENLPGDVSQPFQKSFPIQASAAGEAPSLSPSKRPQAEGKKALVEPPGRSLAQGMVMKEGKIPEGGMNVPDSVSRILSGKESPGPDNPPLSHSPPSFMSDQDLSTLETGPSVSMVPGPQKQESSSPGPQKREEGALSTPPLGVMQGGEVAGQAASSVTKGGDAPSVPEGFGARIETLARHGGGEVSLDVRPPHLGPVGVRVHVDPHTRLVTVQLASHDPGIRHLLGEKESLIKETLSQSGFVLDRFQVVSQNPPAPEPVSPQGVFGMGTANPDTDGSGGFSGQGGSGTGLSMTGGGGNPDLGSLFRQGSGATGQDSGSATYRDSQASEHLEREGLQNVAGIGPEEFFKTGYHRIA